ncbi:MAG: PAS domain-containing protein [Nitrospira sp.]
MTKTFKRASSELINLQKRAELVLAKSSHKKSPLSLHDLRKLVHDIEVKQIELEMQNEELHRSQVELQTAHDRYAELYDFAPAGYLTMNRRGIIQEANLRASLLLGIPRRDLMRQPLMRFVVPSEQRTLAQHCNHVFLTSARQSCDLRIRSSVGPPLIFHLESQACSDGTGALNSCRTVLFDITAQRLNEAEHDRLTTRWRLLLDSTQEGIYGIDLEGRLIFINKAGARMVGSTPEELLGKPKHELMFHLPGVTPFFNQDGLLHKVFRTGQVRSGETCTFRRADGTAISISYSASPLIEAGAITGIVVVFTDVSDSKQREGELIKSQEQFASFMNNLPGFAWIKDEAGRYLYVNPHFQDTLRLDLTARIGVTDREIFPSETAEQFIENDRLVMSTHHVLHTVETFRLNDRPYHGLATKFPILNKETGEVKLGGISIDITDRKRAEEQLQETLARIRMLSQRLDVVREEERTHIARELHDELGIRLTCLKMDLARLRTLLTGSLVSGERREMIEEKIAMMTAQSDQTIVAVQRLVTELRPGILDDLGLVAAIDWQCRDFEQRSGISCTCESVQDEIVLDPRYATAAFRICQEALTNVLRHAHATFVRVLLKQVNDGLMLEVQDDGRGILAEKLTDAASLGLLGMRERASNLGGVLEITGYPGKGTTVTLYLPSSARGDNEREHRVRALSLSLSLSLSPITFDGKKQKEGE